MSKKLGRVCLLIWCVFISFFSYSDCRAGFEVHSFKNALQNSSNPSLEREAVLSALMHFLSEPGGALLSERVTSSHVFQNVLLTLEYMQMMGVPKINEIARVALVQLKEKNFLQKDDFGRLFLRAAIDKLSDLNSRKMVLNSLSLYDFSVRKDVKPPGIANIDWPITIKISVGNSHFAVEPELLVSRRAIFEAPEQNGRWVLLKKGSFDAQSASYWFFIDDQTQSIRSVLSEEGKPIHQTQEGLFELLPWVSLVGDFENQVKALTDKTLADEIKIKSLDDEEMLILAQINDRKKRSELRSTEQNPWDIETDLNSLFGSQESTFAGDDASLSDEELYARDEKRLDEIKKLREQMHFSEMESGVLDADLRRKNGNSQWPRVNGRRLSHALSFTYRTSAAIRKNRGHSVAVVRVVAVAQPDYRQKAAYDPLHGSDLPKYHQLPDERVVAVEVQDLSGRVIRADVVGFVCQHFLTD